MQDLSTDFSFFRPFLSLIISILVSLPFHLITLLIRVASTRHAHLSSRVSVRLAKRPSARAPNIILKSEKIGPPISQGMREYIESVLRRKKSIPYKPCVRRKHVESILGTRKYMTKKVFNLKNTIPYSVHLVDP